MAEKKTFLLRIDLQLFEALQRWSTDEFRSLNGQIEFLLHDALKQSGRLPRESQPNNPTKRAECEDPESDG